MNILNNIFNLINEVTPQRMMTPMMGPRLPPITPSLVNKINTGRRLSLREFQAAQSNRMVPGQPGFSPQIERKIYMQYNQGRK
jgi:hypothetical protein